MPAERFELRHRTAQPDDIAEPGRIEPSWGERYDRRWLAAERSRDGLVGCTSGDRQQRLQPVAAGELPTPAERSPGRPVLERQHRPRQRGDGEAAGVERPAPIEPAMLRQLVEQHGARSAAIDIKVGRELRPAVDRQGRDPARAVGHDAGDDRALVLHAQPLGDAGSAGRGRRARSSAARSRARRAGIPLRRKEGRSGQLRRALRPGCAAGRRFRHCAGPPPHSRAKAVFIAGSIDAPYPAAPCLAGPAAAEIAHDQRWLAPASTHERLLLDAEPVVQPVGERQRGTEPLGERRRDRAGWR